MRIKNLIPYVPLGILILFIEISFSKEVSKNHAKNIAENFLTRKNLQQEKVLNKQIIKGLKNIEELTNPKDNQMLAYIGNIEPKGFLIIAPDTKIKAFVDNKIFIALL